MVCNRLQLTETQITELLGGDTLDDSEFKAKFYDSESEQYQMDIRTLAADLHQV